MQCQNNLKQIGLAVHVFADAQKGLPPLVIKANNWAWPVLLYPYIEQSAAYELLMQDITQFDLLAAPHAGSITATAGRTGAELFRGPAGGGNEEIAFGCLLWGAIQAKYPGVTAGFGGNGFTCPTRRNGVQIASDGLMTSASNEAYLGNPGPISDYAAPTHWKALLDGNTNSEEDSDNNGWLCIIGTEASKFRQALRPSLVEGMTNDNNGGQDIGPNLNAWSPRDDFGYLSDGSSNVLVIGEKHTPRSRLGKCECSQQSASALGGNLGELYQSDCSYLTAFRRGRQYGQIRYLATRPDMTLLTTDPNLHSGDASERLIHSTEYNYAFGSYHTVVHFLVGDGTVTSLNPDLNRTVFINLCDTRDGESISIQGQ